MTLSELIKETCGDLGDNYPAIAERLNAPTEVVNPDAGKVTQTVAPTPITLKMVMETVTPSEMAAVYKSLPTFVADLKTAIDAGDREYMAGLLQIAAAATDDGGKPVIAVATAQALGALLAATVTTEVTAPDTLPGPSLAAAAGLGVVTAMQVQAALN